VADAVARSALAFYRGLGRLAAPTLPFLMRGRLLAGKEDRSRLGERFGRAGLARPAGPLVWVHAASVGEALSVMALIERIGAGGPRVLLTTGTVTSARIAAARAPAGTLHQFAPLDVAPAITRFLDHWRPDLAIFVESEVWPVTVGEIARRAIPHIVVNARLSVRSAQRWSHLAGVAGTLFGRFALVLAQSEADADRLRGLGAGPVVVTGNLKYDAMAPHAEAQAVAELRHAIGDRPVWLAANTHPGEEELVADAHAVLARRFPGLLTLLVPRHPERGGAIRAALAERGLTVAQRSLDEAVGPETAILLADTLGEMGLFYRVSPIAFVGASLVARGGHSPIEAAALNTAVLHGPHVDNQEDFYRAFDRIGASALVPDGAHLAEAVGALMADPAAAAAMAQAGARILDQNRGSLDRAFAAIEPFLAPLAARAAEGSARGPE